MGTWSGGCGCGCGVERFTYLPRYLRTVVQYVQHKPKYLKGLEGERREKRRQGGEGIEESRQLIGLDISSSRTTELMPLDIRRRGPRLKTETGCSPNPPRHGNCFNPRRKHGRGRTHIEMPCSAVEYSDCSRLESHQEVYRARAADKLRTARSRRQSCISNIVQMMREMRCCKSLGLHKDAERR